MPCAMEPLSHAPLTDNDHPVQPISNAGKVTGSSTILGRIGPLEVRLVETPAELSAVQALRYQVFYQELGARPGGSCERRQQDEDVIDRACDHLIIVDTAGGSNDSVKAVGTYRLLKCRNRSDSGGFYSDSEFQLSALTRRHPGKRFLELGRSCVLPDYRGKRTIELLWQGIWAYCIDNGIDVMAGCASFPGTVPAAHAQALSLLHHRHLATSEWHASALPERYNSMDLMPAEAIDARTAISAMPPLIKGYLRLGAMIGEGCVIDRQFNTTDVLVILPRKLISQRYRNHFGETASRFAA